MKAAIVHSRINRIREKMKDNHWDAIYVTSPENHRYVCGFNNPDGQVLITQNEVIVFADFRYIEAAKREVPDTFTVVTPDEKPMETFQSVDVIAYENERMSCAEFEELRKKLPKTRFEPLNKMFLMIRSVKVQEEVDSIVKAQRIAEAALSHLLSMICYDMTEIEVVAELEYYMKKNGSEDKSFDTIAVSGSNSSSPHGVPRPIKLERGFLTLDFGAVIDGYHSDMTRTLVIGKADAEMKRLYDTVLFAQCSAIERMKAGEKNFEMDAVARNIIENAGYHGAFGHSLGHGVGLEIHEKPNLSPRCGNEVLHEGEIVTAEPGIYLAGQYGCRIEDMIWIRENGIVNLTKAPKAMIEI